MNQIEIGAVKFRNALNRVFPSSVKEIMCSAVICAGGSGTRMGGVAKQLMPILSVPCIVYSLLAFEKCISVFEIIVVARPEDKKEIESLCRAYNITKLRCVVPGGDSRQKSVFNGFQKVSEKAHVVAIHDAARPLITSEDIQNLIDSARRYGASCAAKKMTDTVKRADENGMILETVPREMLYTVQTPQVFKTDVYRVSIALNQKEGSDVTDDCALVEKAGFSIKLLELGKPNLKLTTPEDVQVITGILKERKNG